MKNGRLVWRSDTGASAWESSASGLPIHYRGILGLIAVPTPISRIIGGLPDYSVEQIADWLDELETLCFIHASSIDLDADLLAA